MSIVPLPAFVPNTTALPLAADTVPVGGPTGNRAESQTDTPLAEHDNTHLHHFHAAALRRTPPSPRLPRALRKPPPPRRPPAALAQSWGGDEGDIDTLAATQKSPEEQAARRIEAMDTQSDCYDGEPSDSSTGSRNWQRAREETPEAAASPAPSRFALSRAAPTSGDIDNARAALALLGTARQSKLTGQTGDGGATDLLDTLYARLVDNCDDQLSKVRLAQVKQALVASQVAVKNIGAEDNRASNSRYLLLPLILLDAARQRSAQEIGLANDRLALLERTAKLGKT